MSTSPLGRPLLTALRLLLPSAAYRRRLEALREEREEAEQRNDRDRAECAQDGIETITEQLAAAVGLGGRDLQAGAAAERARSAVTQRLKATIRKIAEHQPALGTHLLLSVKTGTYCVYAASGMDAIRWLLQ